ncbi:hypothetical protein AYL99_08117 [Fonsecaea erecta]|uniref:DUF7905 domain-containing protein n=1 Tax=Fonsecaea erecta TaxID=1367422 RepID=A0A178ZC87_9EURO|nr:hypothetical protein AYL99_08117 [Fonsecaea erecta]OAP57379.1 hypothetical protein AYL99_08117 [Fonsecaea erecta]
MSDHEGEGLDLERWEEASLPGDSVFSYAQADVFDRGIVTGSGDFHAAPANCYNPGRTFTGGPRNDSFADTSYPPQQTASVGQNTRHGIPPEQISKVLSPARIQFEGGQPPSGQYKLASNWRHHQAMALRTEGPAQPSPLQRLREIMVRFGAFIRKPEDDDENLFVWGEPHQVAETKAALAQWERDIQEAPREARLPIWAKSTALDGRAENRAERQSRQNAFDQILREAQIDYPVEAALLWPKEPDLEEFESTNSDILDQLRSKFGCRITFSPSDPQHILIGAQSKKDALSLMTRMTNLIKEAIASRDQLVAINLVHLPDHEIFRDRVGLRDIDPISGTYLPTLHGTPLADKDQWEHKRRQAHLDDRKAIKKAIDSSLKGLRISQQHVRMRVVFGELGFLRFLKPRDGAEHYQFDEFYDMATRGQARLLLNGLPVRQGRVTDLPDVLESTGLFSERTEYYSTLFDFQGTSPNTILRLETVFYPSGRHDTESREKRWVELGDTVSRLQLSLINFERPDYQITLDAFPLRTDKSTKVHMSSFQANVTMDRPIDGIKSLPQRRAKYPHGQQRLQRVSELIMLRWRFKSTDGVFELRRKDIYDELPGREDRNPGPVETKWHGLYYYPHWDSLMGEFASVTPGEDIRWVKSVGTFIPEGEDQHGLALPRGFKNFISEVEEIQDVLAEAIARLEKGKGNATESN